MWRRKESGSITVARDKEVIYLNSRHVKSCVIKFPGCPTTYPNVLTSKLLGITAARNAGTSRRPCTSVMGHIISRRNLRCTGMIVIRGGKHGVVEKMNKDEARCPRSARRMEMDKTGKWGQEKVGIQ